MDAWPGIRAHKARAFAFSERIDGVVQAIVTGIT
jgi:hypothetical protein